MSHPELPQVLLVEDNPNNRELLLKYFAKANNLGHLQCIVIPAIDGKEAIELMMSNQPDVILCDVVMPELDGFDVLTTYKNEYVKNKLPSQFVFLTSDAQQRQRAFEEGADGFVVKEGMNYYTFTMTLRAHFKISHFQRALLNLGVEFSN